MRKRMMTLAAVAVLAITLTACGAAQTSNNPTPTVEPTKEVEATTAPTVEPTKEAEATTTPTVEPTATNVPEPTATSTPTPEPTATPVPTSTPTPEPTATPVPTSTPTPEPTATPVPTSTPTPEPTATPVPTSTPTPEPTATPVPTSTPTPEPTATPVPTEAPKADTKDWKTVLRELHSLETYAEREAYVAKLDKSAYKVEKTENFDLINKRNSYEGEVELVDEGEVLIGYIGYSEETCDEIGRYAVDELPEEYRGAIFDPYGDGEFQSVEIEGYGLCYFEAIYGYPTKTQTIYANLAVILGLTWEPFGETAYLMTITDVATGETDPWGVSYGKTVTIEEAVSVYESGFTSEWGPSLVYIYTSEPGNYEPAHIKTWDTLKYYED